MVQRFSATLGLSLRQSNDLLLAAGFALIWSCRSASPDPAGAGLHVKHDLVIFGHDIARFQAHMQAYGLA
jgi:hypothetical protein